ncbi:hypothetical protein [Mycobacteroides chelonae]|uniref:hypothetical protein n=1 Tax=Mycobacteroides chelonae TaxID=1774 RepID=UPI0005C76A98|nr:hypothetical protein [Mycobacteroides chelonae]OHT67796.1 hypothetical protein BKG66_24535 [Mycobacteroides chelonae]OHT69439.1 hypothetical protein BKG67_23070 [Mycobacteroides chelonae]
MTKPTAKPNLIFPTIANHMLNNDRVLRLEKRDQFDRKLQKWVVRDQPTMVPTLAGNISQLNVDRFIEKISKVAA